MSRLLSTEEVAALLECTPQSVQVAARDRRLPGVQYGRDWKFPETALFETLHAEAMANVRAPAAAAANDAHGTPVTVVPERRKSANGGRVRPRPALQRLD